MLPHERSLVEKWKKEPFAIVGVNSDSVKKLNEMVDDGTTTWRNFQNVQEYGKISEIWGVRGWPTIYLIDHKGVIQYAGHGEGDLDSMMQSMIDEAKKVPNKSE